MRADKSMNYEKNHDGSEESIASRVDLNDLMKKVRDQEKKSKRSNLIISTAAISSVVVFGIILTL